MNCSLPIRSLRPSASTSRSSSVFSQQCRHESTRRRLTQRLRIPPAPSFQSGSTTQDHIVFNPPSSTPNVYHTPLKFLPKNDPRRALFSANMGATPVATSSRTSAPFAMNGAPTTLPRPVEPVRKKKYHLKQQDVEEMRKLRAADPKTWTMRALARKFDCSTVFVGVVCSHAQAKKEHDARVEAARSTWGARRRDAFQARQQRKELWGQDA
jgi:hypothetical protein